MHTWSIHDAYELKLTQFYSVLYRFKICQPCGLSDFSPLPNAYKILIAYTHNAVFMGLSALLTHTWYILHILFGIQNHTFNPHFCIFYAEIVI